jgi:DNA-binding NarL/FixJ family response regulator
MEKLRILLADDHPLMRRGIRDALDSEKDMEIVAEASSGAQVLPLVSHTAPDLVILDLRLPEVDGLACLAQIRERHPDVKVAMLSVVNDPKQISGVLEAGACAYILKSIDARDLPSAVRQAVSGAFYCVGNLVGHEAAEAPAGDGVLSEREVQILQAVAEGLSNRAIAKELWLSDQTVKFHLHNIYRKLGVANRTEATRYALEHGITGAVV